MESKGIRNVFDDLAATPEKAENLKIRARLMDGLRAYVGKHELTQAEAADRFGVAQSRVSYLMNGRISEFTIDALINMHTHAGIPVRVEAEYA
jgi:predicted XRE-type DNA-binding protein